MTRDEMNKLIRNTAHPVLMDEIEFHMDLERDGEAYDEVCGLLDVEDRAEMNSERKMLTEARRALVALGFYRPMPKEEIDNTYVTHGTKWHFKMNNVAYTTDHTVEKWMEGA